MKPELPYPLDSYGHTGTCQNDEDGIIAAIISRIPMRPYFVEFGADPVECNCLALRKMGWDGLFMDKKADYRDLIKCEKVTPDNINDLLRKYQVPDDFGVLSIDIDGQDLWVWQAMHHTPPLVVIEYNGGLPMDQAVVMPRDDDYPRPGSHPWGASLLAMKIIGERKGYALVYANNVNAFFVRRDCFANPDDFPYEAIYRAKTSGGMAEPLKHGFMKLEGPANGHK